MLQNARHNSLLDEFAALCKGLQRQVEVEDPADGSRRRPADVLVSGLDAGLPLAVNFAVLHPLRFNAFWRRCNLAS